MKVNLCEMERDVRHMHDAEVIALIRVARAAKAWHRLNTSRTSQMLLDQTVELHAALSDIEDSR